MLAAFRSKKALTKGVLKIGSVECKACSHDIPDDALWCCYCGASVLAALPPPDRDSSGARRIRRPAKWLPIAGAWVFLLLSLLCCTMAAGVAAISTPLGQELWQTAASQFTAPTATPTVRPFRSPLPTPLPTGTPEPDFQSPLATPDLAPGQA